ncbi:DNA -binding domain-containing protein [Pelagibacterium lentulum]|nr:DUF2285 domain-containing protein [Pelagibacterium lentulum]
MDSKAFLVPQHEPPASVRLTEYDRAHMKLYLRLLDAASEGADWREVTAVLFGIDPQQEPIRARRMYETHLARARWMTSNGYRHLLQGGRRE